MKFLNLLRHYCRLDNILTWLPMCVSWIGYFAAPIIGIIYSVRPNVYIICFVIGSICSIAVFCLMYRYINRYHNIIRFLQKNSELSRTCTFLAYMNASQYINTGLEVNSIEITYYFKDRKDINNRVVYPFHVNYKMNAKTIEPLSNFYFHILSEQSSKTINSVNVKFDGYKGDVSPEASSGNLTPICFVKKGKAYEKGANVNIEWDIDFNDHFGIAVEETQRILFYPLNFSTVFSKTATAKINLKLKETDVNHFDKDFYPPQISKFSNGVKESVHTRRNGFQNIKIEYEANIQTRSADIKIDLDSSEVLYAVEFTKRKE